MAIIGAAMIGAMGSLAASQMAAKKGGAGGYSGTTSYNPPVYRPETEPYIGQIANTLGGKLQAYNQYYPFFLQNAMGGASNFLSGNYPSNFGYNQLSPFGMPLTASLMPVGTGSRGWTAPTPSTEPKIPTPGQTAGPLGSQWGTGWTGGDQSAWVPTGNMTTKTGTGQIRNSQFDWTKPIDELTTTPWGWKAPEGMGYYFLPSGGGESGPGEWQLAPLYLPGMNEFTYEVPEYKQIFAPGASSLPTPAPGGGGAPMPGGGGGVPAETAPNILGTGQWPVDPQQLMSILGGGMGPSVQNTAAYKFMPGFGPSSNFGMAQNQLANILGGAYDPTQNPEGFNKAYETASAPLLQSFKEEILPALNTEAMKMGGYSGSGAILARQMAADRLNTQLANLSGDLWGKERELGATMLSRGMGSFMPSMEMLPSQVIAGQMGALGSQFGPEQALYETMSKSYNPLLALSQAQGAQYTPYMSKFQAEAAQFQPYEAQLKAMYAPLLAQLGLGQSAMGMLDPGITQLMQLLGMTSAGGGSTQEIGYQGPNNMLGSFIGGLGGGLNAYKGYVDLQRALGSQTGAPNQGTNPYYGPNFNENDWMNYMSSVDYE